MSRSAGSAKAQRLPPGALDSLAGTYEPVPFLASELVLYESVLATRGSALRATPHAGARGMMGCLTAPFKLIGCLVVIVALALGYLYRDRLKSEAKPPHRAGAGRGAEA